MGFADYPCHHPIRVSGCAGFGRSSAFIKYYRFRADIQGADLSIESGLFRRNEFRIPLSKVQMLDWKSTWLRRKLSLETLQIHQARAQASGGSQGLGITIPGLEIEQSNLIIQAVFPKMEPVSC